MPLQNGWIGYIHRSYQQIKEEILLNKQARVPEITDHTENDLFVKMVSIWSGITEMLGYYLDNGAREVFLSTARKFASGVKIAKLFDYRVKGTNAASVVLRFYFDTATPSSVLIPVGTIVRTKEGVEFKTVSAGVINIGSTFVDVNARQWVEYSNQVLGVSSGLPDQSFAMAANVVQNAVNVVIGVDTWLPADDDTLAYSLPSEKVFVVGADTDGLLYVTFGDGLSGAIPVGSITASYAISQGALGNVAENTITELISAVAGIPGGFTLKVVNPAKAAGGVNAETLADLKRRIPLSVKTAKRAVTANDYKAIAELTPGVQKAGVFFDCGREVEVYVTPTGGGTAPPLLLADVEAFFADKKMITTKVKAKSAGTVNIVIAANVTIRSNYSKAVVSSAIKSSLAAFYSETTQDIGGEVFLSDVYEIIETTPGVINSKILILQPRPAAFPFGGTVTELIWTRETQPGSLIEKSFRIVFNSSTVFQLYRDNIYLGNYSVGTLVTLEEISFTITANGYAINDIYTFKTYPYFGGFKLNEFSIPVVDVADVSLNMSGGI